MCAIFSSNKGSVCPLLCVKARFVLCVQVSLNDLEAERDQLTRTAAELKSQLVSLGDVAEERSRLAEEVAGLNKKNQFLFEELARERLRLESKIETLAEQGETRRRELAAVTKVKAHCCGVVVYWSVSLPLDPPVSGSNVGPGPLHRGSVIFFIITNFILIFFILTFFIHYILNTVYSLFSHFLY